MLNVRPPNQPARGWKDFFIQIATISIGLLIAVSLENLAETIHWRLQVSDGRQRLLEEISFDERVYLHRDDVAECVRQDLDRLKAVLSAVRSKKPVAPLPEFISPKNGPIHHEIWNTLNSAQVLAHFPKSELEKYSEFYSNVQDAEYFMDRESRAWRQLHILEGDPSQLQPQEISATRLALTEAEEMSAGVALLSKQQLDVGRALGVTLDRSTADRAQQEECDLAKRGA